MDKIKQYQELMNAYDVGNELPEFITKKIDQRKALEEIRTEVELVPDIDLNASDLKEQYKAQAHALSLREGARLIDYARYEQLLEQRLSGAIDVGFNRLIKNLHEKVNQDLETLDDAALGRILLLVDNLPNDLQTELLPSTSRLLAVVKVEGPHKAIVSATAREFNEEARNKGEALRTLKEGYPYLSLAFIDSLEELAKRREDMASLLNPAAA